MHHHALVPVLLPDSGPDPLPLPVHHPVPFPLPLLVLVHTHDFEPLERIVTVPVLLQMPMKISFFDVSFVCTSNPPENNSTSCFHLVRFRLDRHRLRRHCKSILQPLLLLPLPQPLDQPRQQHLDADVDVDVAAAADIGADADDDAEVV